MNTSIALYLSNHRKYHADAILAIDAMQERFKAIAEGLSETAQLNATGGSMWLTLDNRDDMKVALTLAPVWSKSKGIDEQEIDYDATVDNVPIKIRAVSGALPASCKLVEEEYEIPASEARIGKRMVLKCAQPSPEQNEVGVSELTEVSATL